MSEHEGALELGYTQAPQVSPEVHLPLEAQSTLGASGLVLVKGQ